MYIYIYSSHSGGKRDKHMPQGTMRAGSTRPVCRSVACGKQHVLECNSAGCRWRGWSYIRNWTEDFYCRNSHEQIWRLLSSGCVKVSHFSIPCHIESAQPWFGALPGGSIGSFVVLERFIFLRNWHDLATLVSCILDAGWGAFEKCDLSASSPW